MVRKSGCIQKSIYQTAFAGFPLDLKQVYTLLKGVIYTKKRKDGNVMKLKSLVALMMAGVMALGLCACTNSGTPDDSSTSDTSEAANAEPVSITTTESWDFSTGFYPALSAGSSNGTMGFTLCP